MTSLISSTIKNRDKPNDIFYTPISLVNVHLNLIDEYVANGNIIYDPFFGDGKYFNNFKFNKNNTYKWSEIVLNKDFFDFNEPVDVIISNPPYSCIDRVLEHSVKLNPHTISYLIGQGNLTTRRIEYMEKNGYLLDKIFFTKVFKWYGMSLICIFTKNLKGCKIMYDRVVHK